MKEKLVIKNFGPIQSLDLELGKMTVLMGPSGSGKSTVLKVLSICRYFSYLVDFPKVQLFGKGKFSLEALRDWGLDGFENDESYIFYKNNHYSFEVRNVSYNVENEVDNPNGVSIFEPKLTSISKEFEKLLAEFERLKPKSGDNPTQRSVQLGDAQLGEFQSGQLIDNWTIPHSFLRGEVKSLMNYPFYIPTERGLQSIFSLGKSSIQNLSDALFNQLASLDQTSKGFKEEIGVEPLQITYKNINGIGYFREKDNSEFYPMTKAASGFKSATPIVLATKYYSSIEPRKRTFLIEEPEQNIFPETQKALVEYLSSAVKQFGHSMILTTHSPYILTALENLMYANKLGNVESGKFKNKVSEIVREEFWIDQQDVSVYYLGENGGIDLMQRDEVLINKEYIDSVSNVVNIVFDQLMDIELQHENGQKG